MKRLIVRVLAALAGPLSFGDRWYWSMHTLCDWSYRLNKRWGLDEWVKPTNPSEEP